MVKIEYDLVNWLITMSYVKLLRSQTFLIWLCQFKLCLNWMKYKCSDDLNTVDPQLIRSAKQMIQDQNNYTNGSDHMTLTDHLKSGN